MKAFLINPYTEVISQVNGDFNRIDEIYAQLTEPDIHIVDCFDSVRFSNRGDRIYVDDEGHLSAGHACFSLSNDIDRFFPGRGLVLGCTENGETTSPCEFVTLEWLNAHVFFPRVESTGEFTKGSEGEVDHPVFGRMTQITSGSPLVRPRKHNAKA